MDWDRSWLEQPIVIIDFETTGLSAATDKPVEIAAVRYQHGRFVRAYQTLLDPGGPIPAEATAVHSITDEMVLGKPTLMDVAHELYDVAAAAIPCAYNAPFDRSFLHAAITGNDCAAFDPSISWIDVYVMVAKIDRFVRGKGGKKLGAACARWGVEHTGAHRAWGDAQATAQLLYRLHEVGKVRDCPLRRLLEHTDAMRAEHEHNLQEYLARKMGHAG
jgi:DNA polymerase-3 subunit epsilon